MPWFRNHYVCFACEGHWLAEHAEAVAADCPFCRVYDVVPYKSDDWSDSAELATSRMVEDLRSVVRSVKRMTNKKPAKHPVKNAPRTTALRRAG